MQETKQATRQGASAATDAKPAAGGDALSADICIIGGGAGGLAVAQAAAAFGRSVVVIEKHKMGGDCLNYGCVPSKALIAAARHAHTMRVAGAFGIGPVEPPIDYPAVHDHVKGVMAAVAPNTSVERYTGLGVRVILGAGRFINKKTVAAGDFRITARRFVISTGSSPLVPDIPGLDTVPYFTNETIFDNDRKLDYLVVIGGGASGLELAQAFARLGSRVTVIEGERVLAKDDPELTAVLVKKLVAEGIDIRQNTVAERVERYSGYVRVHVKSGEQAGVVEGTHILIAAGRRPALGDLNLAAAGIKHDARGITVDRRLRTSNSRVYAIGDVTGAERYTHVATYHAEIVIRRALFRLPAKADMALVPWVTFTDPELAHVGRSEEQARRDGFAVCVLRWPYFENDRAQAERATEGHLKVVTDKKGRILGATIVGAQAGEVIQMWALAISQGLKIKAMTNWIAPYPTFGEINRRAAFRSFAGATANPWLRKAINILARIG